MAIRLAGGAQGTSRASATPAARARYGGLIHADFWTSRFSELPRSARSCRAFPARHPASLMLKGHPLPFFTFLDMPARLFIDRHVTFAKRTNVPPRLRGQS